MAGYAILRVAKIKNAGALSASGQHNFRERETKNADADRTRLNPVDGAKNAGELVQAVHSLLPAKHRKDAVICLEYLITASPEHFGEDWQKGGEWGQAYFADAVRWLEKRHGAENVVCKTVHLDESTPHMAAYVVPRTRDGRLAAKEFVGGRSVLSKMQTSFALEVGRKHGLERGVEGSKAVHQENAKIAPMTAERLVLKKRVVELEREIDRLTKKAGSAGAALDEAKAAIEKAQRAAKEAQERAAKALEVAGGHQRAREAAEVNLEALRVDLAKAQAKADRQQKLNIEGLAAEAAKGREITALKQQVAELEAALLSAQVMRGEAAPAALEAEDAEKIIAEKYGTLPEATKDQARYGKPVEVVGNKVVLHLGMGNHVIQTLPPGVKPPELGLEKGRGGKGGQGR